GGLEIDNQLEFGRRLHRKIGWLLALEDADDICGRLPILGGWVRAIGHKPSVPSEVREAINCRYAVLGRQSDDPLTVSHRIDVRNHNHPAVRLLSECFDRNLDVGSAANWGCDQLHCK